MPQPSLELTRYGAFLHHSRAALTTRPRHLSEASQRISCKSSAVQNYIVTTTLMVGSVCPLLPFSTPVFMDLQYFSFLDSTALPLIIRCKEWYKNMFLQDLLFCPYSMYCGTLCTCDLWNWQGSRLEEVCGDGFSYIEIMCCGPSSGPSHRDGLGEGSQHMLSCRVN